MLYESGLVLFWGKGEQLFGFWVFPAGHRRWAAKMPKCHRAHKGNGQSAIPPLAQSERAYMMMLARFYNYQKIRVFFGVDAFFLFVCPPRLGQQQ